MFYAMYLKRILKKKTESDQKMHALKIICNGIKIQMHLSVVLWGRGGGCHPIVTIKTHLSHFVCQGPYMLEAVVFQMYKCLSVEFCILCLHLLQFKNTKFICSFVSARCLQLEVYYSLVIVAHSIYTN